MNIGEIAFVDANKLEKHNENKFLVVTNCGHYSFTKTTATLNQENDNNDYLLVYLHKGSATVYNEDEHTTYHASAGSVIILKQELKFHHIVYKNEQVSEWYFAYFKGTMAKEFLQKLNLYDKEVYETGEMTPLITSFKNILLDFRLHDFDHDLYRSSNLLSILASISKNIENSLLKSNKKVIMDSIEYMNETYYQGLSLSQYAYKAFMSESNYIKLFKKITGFSPMHYLNQIRIDRAEFALQTTSLSIKKVAESVGFSDQLHFSKIFKKMKGTCPKAFRARVQKTRIKQTTLPQ